MPQEKLTVMISSTARDLPEHRKEILDACARQGMFPLMMEHLPAMDADAIDASLKMVDDAEIYLGVFAHRYGYVPAGHDISITEMEYNRAVERKIPRFIFLMHEDHPVKAADVETGTGAEKLHRFKERVGSERVVNYFTSPADLRAHVINTLSHYRTQHEKRDVTSFHYVSEIPASPEVFIAHPYTLLQTHTLIGRQPELELLTDWITGKELEADGRRAAADSVRIMSVVAIGGMGKSALTWKWFNDIAPQEMQSLAGRMWWSFYESDATFENFVTRALAYVTRRPVEEVQRIPAPERETQLLAALNREPYLLVLDGLERILIAYARMDASHLDDSQVSKERNLRKTADPRVGSFLKKLAQMKNSRILVSSRLYPAELETDGGDPIPGSFKCNIIGLADEDAVELWRAFKVTGSRDELLPVFATFGKHPLLIQALAGEVKRYHRAPGNFAEWRKANPQFEPTKFPRLQDAMAHVLEFALRGLDEKSKRVLHTIAAFRMPTGYDTLAALLVKRDGEKKRPKKKGKGKQAKISKPCTEERELDAMLTELENRGLVGWDKRANRYDLHPIVRGVVWGGLGEDTRRGVYTILHAHFEALPMIDDYSQVNSLEDLTPAIELYNTLIGLGRYDDAALLFYERLDDATLYRLSASRLRVELLEMLFPDGMDQPPLLGRPDARSYTLNGLSQAYNSAGQPGRAVQLVRRASEAYTDVEEGRSITLSNLSRALAICGALYHSEVAAHRGLIITRKQDDHFWEAGCLHWLGSTLGARGVANESESSLQRALRLFGAQFETQPQGVLNSHVAQRALWFREFAVALSLANRAWELAQVRNFESDLIEAARRQGEASLGLNDFATADERLHHALTRARTVNLVEEELPALVALAELRRRQGEVTAAREFLDDVWEAAERGPYPLFHADAYNVLAQIERDEGNKSAAVEAATKAYRLAWCDGPPFAYHWGLEKAKQHLKELGAPEPELPPFDESKFEPMPEVEIDPEDEFHVGNRN
jgi:tetratricopeptide (TPR) repeat protein